MRRPQNACSLLPDCNLSDQLGSQFHLNSRQGLRDRTADLGFFGEFEEGGGVDAGDFAARWTARSGQFSARHRGGLWQKWRSESAHGRHRREWPTGTSRNSRHGRRRSTLPGWCRCRSRSAWQMNKAWSTRRGCPWSMTPCRLSDCHSRLLMHVVSSRPPVSKDP